MPVDNAHKVLTVYAYFKVRPGQNLVSSDFLAIGDRQRWDVADLQGGIDDARRQGWIERGERGWRLTTAGFEEAARMDDRQFAR